MYLILGNILSPRLSNKPMHSIISTHFSTWITGIKDDIGEIIECGEFIDDINAVLGVDDIPVAGL